MTKKMNAEYRINGNRVEIYFKETPDVSIRDALKVLNWKWDAKLFCWRNYLSEENLALAKQLCIGVKKTSSDKKTSLDKKKSSDNNTSINKQDYCSDILKTIFKYTDYTPEEIVVSEKLDGICCNGIKTKYEQNLVNISSDYCSIKIGGCFCPRCHKLYFKNKYIYSSINKQGIKMLSNPYKSVDIGYRHNKQRIHIEPLLLDYTTYKEKYGRDLKMLMMMNAFKDNIRMSTIDSTLKEFGYSWDDINDLPVSEELNKRLFVLFKVNSIEELCDLSSEGMSSYAMKSIRSAEPDRIYYRKDVKKEVKKNYIAFYYRITDEEKCTFLVQCSDLIGSEGNIKYNILNKDVYLELKSGIVNTKYSFRVKDENCYKELTRKKKYEKFRNNIKQGYLDDSNYYEDNNVKLLKVADFLVRSSNYGCTNNSHKIVRINAAVRIQAKNGIMEAIIPAAYCTRCDRYYILERNYESLKKYGYICCRIDKYERIIKNEGNMFSTFQDQSLLTMYGYNVNQGDDLSAKERHRILDFIIDNRIQTRHQIINRLEQNIYLRKNNILMKNAIAKWKEDIEYVQSRQRVAATVMVDSIKVPVKRIKIY